MSICIYICIYIYEYVYLSISIYKIGASYVLSPTKDHVLSPSPTKETLLSGQGSPTNNEEENDYESDYIDDEGIQINTCVYISIHRYISKHIYEFKHVY
jgi:hypothetical protein